MEDRRLLTAVITMFFGTGSDFVAAAAFPGNNLSYTGTPSLKGTATPGAAVTISLEGPGGGPLGGPGNPTMADPVTGAWTYAIDTVAMLPAGVSTLDATDSDPLDPARGRINVNVHADQPPVITVPPGGMVKVASPGTSYTFTPNAIRVTDPDAGTNPLQFTLSADPNNPAGTPRGTITLSQAVLANPGASGISNLTGGDGTTGDITFYASQADAANVFAGLKYTLPAGINGGTLNVMVDDQGFSGVGGAMTTSQDISIAVTNAPQVPTATSAAVPAGATTPVAVTLSPNPADTAVTFFKVTAITGGQLFRDAAATVQINNNDFVPVTPAGGSLTLLFRPAAGFSGAATFQAQAALGGTTADPVSPAVTATITVTPKPMPTPTPTPAPTPAPVRPTPSLITKKASRKGKAKLFIHVTFSDGSAPRDVQSPYQKPGFKNIAVSVDAAGNVVVSAKRGTKTVAQTVSV